MRKIIPWVFRLLLTLPFVYQVHGAGTAGCGVDLPTAEKPGRSHAVNLTREDREYLVHVPSNYGINTPTGLIMSFHGRSSTQAHQQTITQFSNETYNPDMFAVYPQGVDDEWQGDPDSMANDTAFVTTMIDHFSNIYCLDDTRIYATGKSNGGGLTGILACDPLLSQRIAAFAPVVGAFYLNRTDNDGDCPNPEAITLPCNPGRNAIPILEIHGTDDETIPYEGGVRRDMCLPDIAHWVTEWAVRQGLDSNNVTTYTNDKKVQISTFGDGLVVGYRVIGMGHMWPTVAKGDYIDATQLIMDFFNNYTL